MHARDGVATIERNGVEIPAIPGRDAIGERATGLVGPAVFNRPDVLVELDPQKIQHVGRVVVIGDALGAVNGLGDGVEFSLDHVIDLLLPVVLAGKAGGGALIVGVRPFVDQAKHRMVLALDVAFDVAPVLGGGRRRAEDQHEAAQQHAEAINGSGVHSEERCREVGVVRTS